MNIKKSSIETFGVFDSNDLLDKAATVAAISQACDEYVATVEVGIEAEKVLISESLNSFFNQFAGQFISQNNVVSIVVNDVVNHHPSIYNLVRDFESLSDHTVKVIRNQIKNGKLAVKKGSGIARI